jgi:hypothetical protein
MLIQREEDNLWVLWSKNGTNESSEATGPNDKGDDNGKGKAYDSPQAFLDSEENLKEGKREYTEGYVIAADYDQDRDMEAGFTTELDKEYNVATSNCAQAVQSALKNAGFKIGEYIVNINKGKPWYLRREISLPDLAIELTPNLIYGRIKKQNSFTATYKPKPTSIKKANLTRKVKHI